MKKLISYFMIVISVLTVFFCDAFALGEVRGNVYGTDIVAYIYDCPVTSYNIGGRTCIDAEILNWYYGFDVYWYPDQRKLTIDDKGGRFASGQAASGELVEKVSSKAGQVVGNYFETDIVALLNGREITSYNIGGRTVILAEEMSDFGYEVIWDEGLRTLSIDKPMDFYKYKTELGDIKTIYKFDSYINSGIECIANVILVKDKNYYSELVINKPFKAVTDGMGNQYISFNDFAGIFGGRWEMNEGTLTTEDMTSQGMIARKDTYIYSFDFLYDNNKLPDIEMSVENTDMAQWQNTGDKLNVVKLSHISQIKVNGADKSIYSQYGGKVYNSYLIIYKDELYIPVQMVAELMDYDLATLNTVRYSVDK